MILKAIEWGLDPNEEICVENHSDFSLVSIIIVYERGIENLTFEFLTVTRICRTATSELGISQL